MELFFFFFRGEDLNFESDVTSRSQAGIEFTHPHHSAKLFACDDACEHALSLSTLALEKIEMKNPPLMLMQLPVNMRTLLAAPSPVLLQILVLRVKNWSYQPATM